MEQVDESCGNRGAMTKRVTLKQLEDFAMTWVRSEEDVVQNWGAWEKAAEEFFSCGRKGVVRSSGENMHGAMNVVIAIASGGLDEVKKELRQASPSALAVVTATLTHFPQFSAVIDAENRFRLGELDGDWTIEPDERGHCLVRSRFRARDQDH